MADVIKRNGNKERFNEDKIKNSIKNAAKGTELSVQTKRRVIDRTIKDINQVMQDRDEIETAKIRNIVINQLEKEGHEDKVPIERAWRNYELKHGIIYKE